MSRLARQGKYRKKQGQQPKGATKESEVVWDGHAGRWKDEESGKWHYKTEKRYGKALVWVDNEDD